VDRKAGKGSWLVGEGEEGEEIMRGTEDQSSKDQEKKMVKENEAGHSLHHLREEWALDVGERWWSKKG
jgi:hypothetical protein